MALLTTKRIAVLMGGRSAEREISIRSGTAVKGALERMGYNVIAIDVDKDIVERLKGHNVEIAFISLHGKGGEDGTIQGLLELLSIPYTGSGVLASAIGMDKLMTKKIAAYHKIPTPDFFALNKREWETINKLPGDIKYPVVIKPSSQGSTLGISIVREDSELSSSIEDAFTYDDEIIIEQYIDGREITVGILNDNPLPVIEIIPEKGFYDFTAKYTEGKSRYIIPADLPDGIYRKVQGLALLFYQVLGCRGAARVDFRIDTELRPYLLEINTIPGMAESSLLPKSAKKAGVNYERLVEMILVGNRHACFLQKERR
ncbi:MAG: D-alanine--D-alanine ligase [Nitrospirota bacterium]